MSATQKKVMGEFSQRRASALMRQWKRQKTGQTKFAGGYQFGVSPERLGAKKGTPSYVLLKQHHGAAQRLEAQGAARDLQAAYFTVTETPHPDSIGIKKGTKMYVDRLARWERALNAYRTAQAVYNKEAGEAGVEVVTPTPQSSTPTPPPSPSFVGDPYTQYVVGSAFGRETVAEKQQRLAGGSPRLGQSVATKYVTDAALGRDTSYLEDPSRFDKTFKVTPPYKKELQPIAHYTKKPPEPEPSKKVTLSVYRLATFPAWSGE